MLPLDHIRILDLSRVLSGPFCTMILADMGAEVIKVEQPGKGDDTRAFGPPFKEGESAYFLSINRNKKSITVNLKNSEGLKIIEQLMDRSDVFIENFRPGTLDKLNLSFPAVHARNPGLIYASISGFGHSGLAEFCRQPGYDLVIQGLGGIASVTGDPQGPPMKSGVPIADLIAGLYAVQGILLALLARERTGKGQHIDISMLDGQVSLLTFVAGIAFMTGKTPERMGNCHPTICPYETFQVADGFLNISVGNDAIWERFCKIIERPDLIAHPDYATNADRVENRQTLIPLLKEILICRDRESWIDVFTKAGVPCGPIQTVTEVLSHPQIIAREMVTSIEHRSAGTVQLTGIPVKLSETPGKIATPPPRLGEHTDQILSKILGYSDDQIKNLRETGAI